MRFEREKDEGYRRLTVELDPWVERTVVFLIAFALTGAGATFVWPLSPVG